MLRRSLRLLRNVTMARDAPENPLIIILGATGTGKSELAIDLATRYNGEVINSDAMQMYEGLPIITNKATLEEQKGIPHHLLGFISLDEEPWRVGLYKEKASKIIREIRSRGRLPIVVGGTHYYTQSLLFRNVLLPEQRKDGDDSEDIQYGFSTQEIDKKFPILAGPTEEMLQRLREVDPIMADQWHPNDRRKIRRSLEIFLMSGKKASDTYEDQRLEKVKRKTEAENLNATDATREIGSPLLFWVHSEAEVLKQRLDARVHKMILSGLLDEVKSMDRFLRTKLDSGVEVDRTRGIWVSIGWKEYEPYLNAAASSISPEMHEKLLEASLVLVQTATRQYARRQTRWIRGKLIPELLKEEILDKLYLLDGTNLQAWSDSVSKPALNITEAFLTGEPIPVPAELSDAAREILCQDWPASPTSAVRHECDLCHVVVVVEDQWQKHLQSRTHRRMVRKGLASARRPKTKPTPEGGNGEK
ncbi:IPP transferase-domain-containing protein [Calycina marina]|uniref:tRNA dimethylallyltransferase n=1 Tax=Calycina marina TaxID=1763456 RepID=A0A9P7Z657_9HELO|nr:IPP transferase-domain-containing protein [Calycina marina]